MKRVFILTLCLIFFSVPMLFGTEDNVIPTTGVSGFTCDISSNSTSVGNEKTGNDTLTPQIPATSEREWIQCADRPTPELCHATAYDPIDDKVYAFGGGDGMKYANWTYQYDPVTDAWASLTAMPTAINWIDASVTEWNRSIYIFGGYNGVVNNFNYIYDINGDSWSTGASMPQARIAGGQVVYNDSLIYYLGGYTGSGGSNTVYIYNTYTDSWTTGPTGTGMPKSDFMEGVAMHGDTIWLVGGYEAYTCYNNLYYGVIDPSNCETITWSTGDTLPIPNFNNGATQLVKYGGDLCLYMVGGFEYASTITNHAWEYNVGIAYWSALPDYPTTIARNDILVGRQGPSPEIYVNGGDDSGIWTPTAQTWKMPFYIGVAETPAKSALTFGLTQNAPNPVRNGKATISYSITNKGPVTLKIYNSAGRLVRTLVDRNENPGQKTVTWNGFNNNHNAVAAGVYFYRLTAENKTATRKIITVK